MKQKDLLLICISSIVSAILAFVLSNALFSSPTNRNQQVEVVDSIETSFERPDQKYFNANSLNPTQLIKIGDNPNQTPFNAPPGQ